MTLPPPCCRTDWVTQQLRSATQQPCPRDPPVRLGYHCSTTIGLVPYAAIGGSGLSNRGVSELKMPGGLAGEHVHAHPADHLPALLSKGTHQGPGGLLSLPGDMAH